MSGLHPDNRDPVLSEYNHLNAESDSNHCVFRQSTQYLLVVKLQACEERGGGRELSAEPCSGCFSVAAGLFTLAGFYQMAVWAKAKHRNYLKEFKDYPRRRASIIPFLL